MLATCKVNCLIGLVVEHRASASPGLGATIEIALGARR